MKKKTTHRKTHSPFQTVKKKGTTRPRPLSLSPLSSLSPLMTLLASLLASATRGARRTRTGWSVLTPKLGPVGFYKGRGVPSAGRLTRKGEVDGRGNGRKERGGGRNRRARRLDHPFPLPLFTHRRLPSHPREAPSLRRARLDRVRVEAVRGARAEEADMILFFGLVACFFGSSSPSFLLAFFNFARLTLCSLRIVVADGQVGGRGKGGRCWFDRRGARRPKRRRFARSITHNSSLVPCSPAHSPPQHTPLCTPPVSPCAPSGRPSSGAPSGGGRPWPPAPTA